MIDSFITYDSNPAGENSPGFFSKHFNEIFSYNFAETDNYSLLPNNTLPPINEELPQENLIEQFSSNSAYSTNPSVKHSPEYTPNEEDQPGEDDKFVPSKVPPITRKGIKKQYEPIFDNGMAFYYEEDPVEYRKARKRIQNRESATRVRNRKRTRAEELEDEVKLLTQDKAELKVQNAALVAENNMLRSQIGRLERMISKTNQEEIMIDGIDSLQDASRTENSDSIMHLINKTDDDIESIQAPTKYFRAPPAHNFKKHVAMLGVFTLLLCVYGLVPRTGTHTSLFSQNGLFMNSRPHSLFVGLKTTPSSPINSGNLPANQNDGETGENPILWAIRLLVMVCYFAYLIYVSVGFFKYRALRKKAYVYTSLSS